MFLDRFLDPSSLNWSLKPGLLVMSNITRRQKTLCLYNQHLYFPTQFAFSNGEISIYGFDANGRPIYCKSDNLGHIYWDVWFCAKCIEDEEDLFNDRPSRKKKKKKNSQQKLREAYENKSAEVDLLGEPSRKFDYYVKYTPPPTSDESIILTSWDDDDDNGDPWDCDQLHKKWDWDNSSPPSPQIAMPIAMFHPPQQEEFPPLSSFDKEQSTHAWKIRNPISRKSDGLVDQLSAAEAVLNWQSENAVQQNSLLRKIDQSQQRIERTLQQQAQTLLTPLQACKQKIETLHVEIMTFLQNRLPITDQEREIRNLKKQLISLENNSMIPPSTPYHPISYTHISQTSGPMYSTGAYESTFSLFTPEEWEKKLTPLSHPDIKKTKPLASQNLQVLPPPNPEKRPQMLIKNPITTFLQKTQNRSSITPILIIPNETSSELEEFSDEFLEDHPLFYMADRPHSSQTQQGIPVVDEPEIIDEEIADPHVVNNYYSQNSTSATKFTFDDIPPVLWKARFQEMKAWCLAELRRPNMTHSAVIKSFLARITGFLKDWYDALGEYRQIQYSNSPTIDAFIESLYWEFWGKTDHLKDIAREEFFKLKCCSYNPKDLDKHFHNASRRYYLIGGMDDTNIKQAYLESIPQPLGQETLRMIEIKGQSLGTTSFGELHNWVKRTLKKLCNQREFLKDISTTGQKFEKACDQPDLKIKCRYDNKSCDCLGKKKFHRRRFKFRNKRFSKFFPRRRRYFKRKFTKKKGDRCFICGKKGHFVKIVPTKRRREFYTKSMQQRKWKKKRTLNRYSLKKMSSPLKLFSYWNLTPMMRALMTMTVYRNAMECK
ncbi:uncharacterized protein LOC111397527 [Olea europaea var. sylvestris]|uniref:uncharacterized protein LOC111397527 n=1 Tax=Olea europaea var. sylvestris TaxID=158386 RepID=UPI000C1CD288|nr:uncharacterized protein LOC111397527 [Olea europaea var. sylvestris]XP_022880272.1 uncharacterized protein LOC111397527 [Olea europaea var. sylvestris]